MERQTSRRIGFVAAVLLALVLAAGAGMWFSPTRVQQRRDAALIAACTAGSVEAAEAALARGARINARDGSGLTPLMYAARGNNPDMAHPDATDHPQLVQWMITNGADVNAATPSGFVALFWSARYGHAGVAKALIDHGANVNAADTDAMTALKWAQTNRAASPAQYDRVITLLKEAGAK